MNSTATNNQRTMQAYDGKGDSDEIMEDFFTSPRLSLDSDDIESNPIGTPVVSPFLESSQPLYSPSLYEPGYMFDMSSGAGSWETFSTQAPELEPLMDNVMPCSTFLYPDTSSQSLMGFSTEVNKGIRASNEESGRPSPSTSEETSKQKAYRPNWGTSTGRRNAKRRTKSASESSIGSRTCPRLDSSHRLRTAKRTSSFSKTTSSSDSDNKKSIVLDGNFKHNLTEKRYRSRLNDKFETLLSALPPSLVADTQTSADHPEKKISKAEVLILAKEHIRALERAAEDLEGQNQALSDDMERLRKMMKRAKGLVQP
ncbi:uncharacterized protein PAC_01831 [Phialocephala subalpina]|uniref:BHLH domain-containing protein n=1 Tax=Phialocephala subalpina TaxID=576137 RepID=A0A1L7WGQ1_9HELO|nr:uncharacterized protein PAC_01831 [Phialocephala subalpina]